MSANIMTPLGCWEDVASCPPFPPEGTEGASVAVGPWYDTIVRFWVKLQEVTGGQGRVKSSWNVVGGGGGGG